LGLLPKPQTRRGLHLGRSLARACLGRARPKLAQAGLELTGHQGLVGVAEETQNAKAQCHNPSMGEKRTCRLHFDFRLLVCRKQNVVLLQRMVR